MDPHIPHYLKNRCAWSYNSAEAEYFAGRISVLYGLTFTRTAASGTTDLSRHIFSSLNFGCAQRYGGKTPFCEKSLKKSIAFSKIMCYTILALQSNIFLLYKVTQRHRCTLSITCTVKIVEQTIKEYISCGRSLIGALFFIAQKNFPKSPKKIGIINYWYTDMI